MVSEYQLHIFKQSLKTKKMDFKKLLGSILVIVAGVAVYDAAVKPLLNKAKLIK